LTIPSSVGCLQVLDVTTSSNSSGKTKLLDLESKILQDWQTANYNSTFATSVLQEEVAIEATPALEEVDNGALTAQEEAVNEESALQAQIAEIVKIGWSEADARRALLQTRISTSKSLLTANVDAALELLAGEDELKQRLEIAAENLVNLGWLRESAVIALNETKANESEALQILEQEEQLLQSQFEATVTDLVSMYNHLCV
jgi:hypothetical protein